MNNINCRCALNGFKQYDELTYNQKNTLINLIKIIIEQLEREYDNNKMFHYAINGVSIYEIKLILYDMLNIDKYFLSKLNALQFRMRNTIEHEIINELERIYKSNYCFHVRQNILNCY